MITSDLRLSQDGVTSSCWNGKKAKIMVALLPHPNIPWDLKNIFKFIKQDRSPFFTFKRGCNMDYWCFMGRGSF